MRNFLCLVAAISLMFSGCTGSSSEITRPDTSDIEVKPLAKPAVGGGGAQTESLGAAPPD